MCFPTQRREEGRGVVVAEGPEVRPVEQLDVAVQFAGLGCGLPQVPGDAEVDCPGEVDRALGVRVRDLRDEKQRVAGPDGHRLPYIGTAGHVPGGQPMG